VDGGDDLRRRGFASQAGHQVAHLGDGEARERHPLADLLPDQLADGLHERMLGQEPDVSVGCEHERARVAELSREELEQQERRPIGAVKVVEDEDDGPAERRAPEAFGHAVEESEARLLRIHARERGQVRKTGAQLGHHGGDVCRARPELRRELRRVPRGDPAAQDLDPRPEGRGTCTLPAAADEHLRAARSRPARELLRRLALPDPGLADEEDHSPASSGRGGKRAVKHGQLPLATDEHGVAALHRAGTVLPRRVLPLPVWTAPPQIARRLDRRVKTWPSPTKPNVHGASGATMKRPPAPRGWRTGSTSCR
jgi:hypothetical protein